MTPRTVSVVRGRVRAAGRLAGVAALGLSRAEVTFDPPPSQLDEATAGRRPPADATGNAPTAGSTPGAGSVSETPPASDLGDRNRGEDRTAEPASAEDRASALTSAREPSPDGLLLLDDFEDGDAAGWIADRDDGDDLFGSWTLVEAEDGYAAVEFDDVRVSLPEPP